MEGRTRKQDRVADQERAEPPFTGDSFKHLVVTLTRGIRCTKHDVPAERGKGGLLYCPECKREG